MDPRQQRGLMIAALCKLREKDGFWTVPSQSNGGNYLVTLKTRYSDTPACNCKDFESRGEPCKHVYAVQYVAQREQHADGSETVTETMTVKAERVVAKRKTYKQDWKAYNAAQTTEKDKVQLLLADLCKGIEEPAQEKGRPSASLRDMVFASVFKVFSTVSARRFQCDLNEACEQGHISMAPHYNTVFKYLEMPELTPILRELIAQSALRLKAVDVDFAVDSTGFTSSQFVRWFDHKYGKPMQEHDWVKVSIMTGVKTNVVTAVEVDGRNAGDSPKLVPLVKATAKSFTINEVSADAAYASHENMNTVAALGATPFIAFKATAKPKDDGSVYRKMFHYYSLRRDEFLSHYHKRSNVETTISMIKAKFGDSLRSKTDTAMVNEALCKILCHNLCCLVQSAYELGVTATFWGAECQSASPKTESSDMIDALAWI